MKQGKFGSLFQCLELHWKLKICSFEWENFMNGETVHILMIKLEWSTKFVIKFPGDGSSTEMFNYIHFKQNTHILMCIFCQIERQHSVGGIKFNLDKSNVSYISTTILFWQFILFYKAQQASPIEKTELFSQNLLDVNYKPFH